MFATLGVKNSTFSALIFITYFIPILAQINRFNQRQYNIGLLEEFYLGHCTICSPLTLSIIYKPTPNLCTHIFQSDNLKKNSSDIESDCKKWNLDGRVSSTQCYHRPDGGFRWFCKKALDLIIMYGQNQLSHQTKESLPSFGVKLHPHQIG